jgi:deoxyribonuclease (pyrimidine dimer)
MTRINSAISVEHLTDEHLMAEHREIKRLPYCFLKHCNNGKLRDIPSKFCLGVGHITFFLDKAQFTFNRYKQIHKECLRRGFNVTDYSENWKQVLLKDYWNDYISTEEENQLLVQRISDRILKSNKPYFHYNGECITKERAIQLLIAQ